MTLLYATMYLAFSLPLDVCSAESSREADDGKEIEVTGTLVFDYHSAYVWKKKDGSATGCALYAVFPATPLFAIPGIEERELKSDPRLDNFILSYRKYLKLNPNQFRTFVIRGRLKVTKNYKGRGRGKIGFGQNAGFRSAIIIEQISDSIPGAKL